MFQNREICDFIYINNNFCSTQTKLIEQITRKTFLGFTVFTMCSFNMVLFAPVCAYTPLYALVRPCLRLSALFSHTREKTDVQEKTYNR